MKIDAGVTVKTSGVRKVIPSFKKFCDFYSLQAPVVQKKSPSSG